MQPKLNVWQPSPPMQPKSLRTRMWLKSWRMLPMCPTLPMRRMGLTGLMLQTCLTYPIRAATAFAINLMKLQ